MLQRAIQRFKPDILHFHFPNTSAFAALALPAARRLPWVVHWHADVVPSRLDRGLAWTYRYYRLMEQAVLAHSACIIATSPAYLESSPALSKWRHRAVVIPLGIEPQQLPEPSPGIRRWATGQWSNSRLRILGIGRLAYYKGFDVLLRAAAALPDCRVLLVGEGPCRSALERIIQDHQLRDRAQLMGYLPGDLLCGLMATTDVLCLPSVERTEAFGLVLLEAMRYGRPVVVSDIPGSGVGWVVREAGHGLLVPPGDVHALTMALERLRTESALRESLGAAGTAHLANFHIERTLRQLREVYSDLIVNRHLQTGSPRKSI